MIDKWKKRIWPNQAIEGGAFELDNYVWITVPYIVWVVLYPHPYKIAISVGLALPIIGLLINRLFRSEIESLVSVGLKDDKNVFDFVDFVQIPTCGLLLRSLIDYNCLDCSNLIILGSGAGLLLFFIIWAAYRKDDNENEHAKTIYFLIWTNMIFYGFVATYTVNCVFDQSPSKVYHPKVVGKNTVHNKHTTYHLEIEPWDGGDATKSIAVGKFEYDTTVIGRKLEITCRKGLLEIPWFTH